MHRTPAHLSASERATPVVMLGRRLRILAVVIVAIVFAAAAVGFVMGVAAGCNPGARPMAKTSPFKQHRAPSPEIQTQAYAINMADMCGRMGNACEA